MNEERRNGRKENIVVHKLFIDNRAYQQTLNTIDEEEISIPLWNAQGLKSKLNDSSVHDISNNVDVVLFTET